MSERLKRIGSAVLGVLVVVALIAIPIMFIKGAVWMGEHVMQWLINAAGLVFLLDLVLILPLTIFRRSRPWAGLALYLSSYLFGLVTWFLGLLLTYTLWGLAATIIGLLFAGVGVVVMGILAALFKGMWPELMWLTIYLVVTFGTRTLGMLLAASGEKTAREQISDAFSAASDSYDAAFDAIEPYTTRANHRYAILSARSALYKAPLDDPYAADAYDEAVAAYTDPTDFDQYTEAYLDAHTVAIDTLMAAFDTLTAAFGAFNPADDLYASAAALYKSSSDIYTFAANAYSNAAVCAMITALEGNHQAAKDEWQARLLENRATNPAEANPDGAKAKTADDATKAKVLEQKARVAETKAEVFLAKAKSAEARAEEALETSQ